MADALVLRRWALLTLYSAAILFLEKSLSGKNYAIKEGSSLDHENKISGCRLPFSLSLSTFP
jgi:hypothetical protein